MALRAASLASYCLTLQQQASIPRGLSPAAVACQQQKHTLLTCL